MPRENHKLQRYQKIDYATRINIVEHVLEQNQSIASVGSKFNISHSTIRSIVNYFKQKGTVFEKKEDKMKRMLL